MTSRQRNKTSATSRSRNAKRRHLLESLEARQLLAGPELIGIQPNEGELIDDGAVRDTAPRILTFRFDDQQRIDANTLSGIQIVRSGGDGVFGEVDLFGADDPDEIEIVPGLVTIGDPNENEVVVRFAENLPDDDYQIRIYGYDDQDLGIVGLRNLQGELIQPSVDGTRIETVQFELDLGALIEAVVPQPVVRNADGSLAQNRDEIVVYFNEDPLFVEDQSFSGSTTVAGATLSVSGDLVSDIENTDVVFTEVDAIRDQNGNVKLENGSPVTAEATFDPEASTLSIQYVAGTPISEVARAVSQVDGFTGQVTSGSAATPFDPPLTTSTPRRSTADFRVVRQASDRSAENPRFYQLLLTQETARTTDDDLIFPQEVIYDETTHTARLIFDQDINNYAGPEGGTFRLRVGTAVDKAADLIVVPQVLATTPSATIPLGVDDASFSIVSRLVGESASGQIVRFVNSGTGGLTVAQDGAGAIVFNVGGGVPLISDLTAAVASNATIRNLITISVDSQSSALPLPTTLINGEDVRLVGLGDTLGEALDVGVFGQNDALTSLVISESISPIQIDVELPGSDDDAGHRLLIDHINEAFGGDTQNGVTEIPYNFQGVYQQIGNQSFLNQITSVQKTRIREVLELWSQRIGVQFYETADQGITFALGETTSFQAGTTIPQLQASVAVDAAINSTATAGTANASIVFSNQASFGLDYGEDFTRKAAAGVGLLLGLMATPDLAPNVLMSLSAFNQEALLQRPKDGGIGEEVIAPTTDPLSSDYQRFDDEFPEFRGFLNDLIDPFTIPDELPFRESSLFYIPDNIDDFQLPNWEPVFPSNTDVLHGQYVHRPDSVDVDLYRFEIDLDDADRVGTLSVETFAERLGNSSELDTTITLFQETRASATTDLRVGPTLQLRIEAVDIGTQGNGSRIQFVQSDRLDGDDTIYVMRVSDGNGGFVNNAILLDVPRQGTAIDSVPVSDLIDAIRGDAFASSLFQIELVRGSLDTDISAQELRQTPIVLGGGGVNPISRNDDYFSEDSFLTASLGEGVYYIGIAASGNDTYDPMIPGSGFGGLSQGDYELRLKFEPQVDEVNILRDRDAPQGGREGVPGTAIDGDGDGVPGGVHNFWFQTRSQERRIDFILSGEAITPNQTITVTGATGVERTYEFVPIGGVGPAPGNVLVRYNATPGASSSNGNLAALLTAAINSRQSVTGVRATTSGTTMTLTGERSIEYSNDFRGVETFGRMIYVDKLGTTNADGSLTAPFNNINNQAVVNAFGSASENDIVRIVGNGGVDGNLATEVDNFAYEFGLSETGGIVLEDGRNMEVPKGVTTMIDAGTILKFRAAYASVGSDTAQIDRSGGVIQVLGTPRLVDFNRDNPLIGDENAGLTAYDDGSVIFTSTRDRAADRISAGTSPAPGPGDWGGITFRRDLDQAEGRRNLEDEGIFLQTVNHAEIRYGGSSDVVSNSGQTFNPIQMINLRPNITFNEITQSADAAMSAAPNSFLETTFGTPDVQAAGSFTPDYNRVGPDIHNNLLVDNSINGLFIRTIVSPTTPPTQLTGSARLDDTSVVHFIAENLVVAGTPGGSVNDGIRPSLAQSSAQALAGGALPAGTQRVAYLMTFVDQYGFESAASVLDEAITLSAPAGSSLTGRGVELAGLPGTPIGSDYVSRRLYRAEYRADGTPMFGFRLIANLDASSVTYNDDGNASTGTLSLTRSAVPNLDNASIELTATGNFPATTSAVSYVMTFVNADGEESAPTPVDEALSLSTTGLIGTQGIRLTNLPQIPQGTDFVARRLYRAELDVTGSVQEGYRLVTELAPTTTLFDDDGTATDQTLDFSSVGRRGRLDASLVIDPSIVVKLQGARIELGQGTQLLAEGIENQPVVFTSSLDDRYGAGGTFDTNNDQDTAEGNRDAERGDWSGIYAGPNATVSLDHAVVSYGGGISLIEGGESRGFAPLELQQADGRVTNSRFEFNDNGQDGSGPAGRRGRLAVDPSVIFVRGSQPTIVNNEFVDNRGAVVGIDADSLTADYLQDIGRQTGDIGLFSELDDNHGPLIRLNRYENVPADDDDDKQISGLVIRGGELLVESVWDDTDIVHVLNESVSVGNIQSSGGLRLQSRPNESLVVKLSGSGTPNDDRLGTGLTATGSTSDSPTRRGGTVHIIGLPGAPVVLTSFKDDTVGAGLSVDGSRFTDTNGDSYGSRPQSNDWRSILLDQYSNDRNFDITLEQELSTDVAPGRNGTIENAQNLGELAANLNQGDENRRLGFEVGGYLSGPTDVDTYRFNGSPGSVVWFDIDRTQFSLDTVIEFLDSEGNLLARSDDSRAGSLTVVDDSVNGLVGSLQSQADQFTKTDLFDNYYDEGSINPRDAGFRVVLPGNTSSIENRSVYYFRVRSASIDPNDVSGGGSQGNYRVQVRLQESQEYPGSVVRYADIRFANHGVHVRGLPGESPLLGEAGENEATDPTASNDDLSGQFVPLASDFTAPKVRAQNVGNLFEGKKPVISVAGELSDGSDIDFYQLDLDALQSTEDLSVNYFSTIFDIDYADGLTRPDTNLSIFYDSDGEFGPALPQLVLFGSGSNVAEDQASPFGEQGDLTERLSAGSLTANDPLIGPVSLPEGSYYVAVTSDTVLPLELQNVAVRREPINSIRRLFEDRIDNFDVDGSVADPPVYDELFSDIAIVGGGFEVTNVRGNEIGHGVYGNFDNSNISQVSAGQTLYSELGFTGGLSAPYTDLQFLPDASENPLTALDLSTLEFSLENNAQIGGTFDYTATTLPHVTIEGSMTGDFADFYQLVVTEDNTRVIIDVDEGYNPIPRSIGSDLDDIVFDDFGSVDLDLVILDASPAILTPPGRITDSLASEGQLGSIDADFIFDDAAVINRSLDPFFDGRLAAGVYFIGIVETLTDVSVTNAGVIEVQRDGAAPSGRYILHVSIEDTAEETSLGSNESIRFNRNTEVNGQLLSNSFDLTGYSAEDLPRFYFNYLWDSPQDFVSMTITSNENAVGSTLSTFQNDFASVSDDNVGFVADGQWRQNIIPLDEFAGHTGIRIEFEYNGDAAPVAGADGLFLDDFIIGFAERGETVFNSIPGQTDFNFSFAGIAGEYQLEMRTATSYAEPTGFRQTLTRSFDTNDRHTQEVTLSVPAGSQINDGDTIFLSDGKRSQVFEFDTNGSTGFDRQRITFDPADTAVEMAMRLRDAINATNRLEIEAASASGLDTEDMTSNRLNLFGVVDGSFDSIDSHLDAPDVTDTLNRDAGSGYLLLPAVLHLGSGDANYTRTQSQILIENNVISDVHAIGIWSDPGDRGTDPEDLREDPTFDFFNFFNNSVYGLDREIETPHPFLQLPPVGNPAAGIVRNLPTLNDSVEGGLMPGVTIRNNTIDQAGMSGIKIQGETRPFVIDIDNFFFFDDDQVNYQTFLSNVSFLPDGYAMAIDAGGTRVVFEFEDVAGAPTTAGGSGQLGGDGWADGHVPIYYRHPGGAPYNNAPDDDFGYNSFYLMLSIQQAIQGSILVTNDMAELVTATLAPSPNFRNGFFEEFASQPSDFPTTAVFVEGVSNIYFTDAYAKGGAPDPFCNGDITCGYDSIDEAAIAEAPQPLAKIVNNTIHGNDGTLSLNPENATADDNDVLADATITHLGDNHAGPYIQTAAIGYNVPVGLTNQTVGLRAVYQNQNLTDLVQATVGIGTEFTDINSNATDGRPFDAINADFDISNQSVVIDFTGTGTVVDGSFNGYIVTGDFSELVSATISDASTVGADVTFTDTELRINLQPGEQIDGNDLIFVSLQYPALVLPSALAGIDDVNDLDLYQVDLGVGDRLIVDIDTDTFGPDTVVQIFDEFGQRQILNFGQANETLLADNGIAPAYLDPESTVYQVATNDAAQNRPGSVNDLINNRDPYVDFTALATGTYYVGVSSLGNEAYDPNSVSGRTGGFGGTGEYQIGLEVYAPRQFVMSLDNESEGQNAGNTGTKSGDGLVGTTFTVTQIPDFAADWPNFPISGGIPNTTGNQVTFEFTDSVTGVVLPNGNYNVPLIVGTVQSQYRVPEIMHAIAQAFNGLQDPVEGLDIPSIPNYENGNGPLGRSGPVTRGVAKALGGRDGDNAGIVNLSDPSRREGISRTAPPSHPFNFGGTDFFYGFGHDRQEAINASLSANDTVVDGYASTELYVLFQNIADIELSPEAMAAGLKLTTNDYRPSFDNTNRVDVSENSDQLILESGIWVTGGASPTIVNNVLSNVHQSIVVDETARRGFGKRVRVDGDEFIKPQEVIINGTVFQYDEPRNSEIRFDLTWPIDPNEPFDVVDTSLSTDDVVGATNVTLQGDDFNFFVQPGEPLLENVGSNNFLPAAGSVLIDSATSSINERNSLGAVKASVGLVASNILAPDLDVNGILRADNPNFATPGGLGQTIFKDRGSSELADFIGPVAIARNPRDNDAAGLDLDLSTSFIQRNQGVLSEFQIQLVDTGDASDPFTGIGVDDSSVIVAEIAGLRPVGANLTLFENDELLEEGIDYTFNYDQSSNLITLKPLAGVWRSDRSYRIALNNRDRSVVVAPEPSQVSDGDQILITDSDGGQVVFEFESGYQLYLPEAISLIVPNVGTDAGGLRDGDIFRIDDGLGDPVVFEFDRDGVLLPGSIQIELPTQPTPADPDELQVFLEGIAESIRNAIAVEVDPITNQPPFDYDVKVQRTVSLTDPDQFIDYRVIIGAPAGVTVDTSSGGLTQDARTLAIKVPDNGTDVGGVADGDTFTISNGNITETFELTIDPQTVNRNAVVVQLDTTQGELTGPAVAQAINDAILASDLGLSSIVQGSNVFLNLPSTGFVSTVSAQMSVIGLSRPINDGDLIRVSRPAMPPEVALEINAAYPAGLAVDTVGALVDGAEIVVSLSEQNRIRMELDAGLGADVPVTSVAIDVTEVIIDPITGAEITVLISREELTRRIAQAISDANIGFNIATQDTFIFLRQPAGQQPVLQSDFAGIQLVNDAQFVERETLEFNLITADNPTGDGFNSEHEEILYRLSDTATELAIKVKDKLNLVSGDDPALDAQPDVDNDIVGLLGNSQVVAPGQIQVDTTDANGSITPVLLSVTDGSSLEVRGEPGVTGSSTIQVFGPLLLSMPTLGGFSITNGSVMTIEDDNGVDVIFQFVFPQGVGLFAVPGAVQVPIDSNTTATQLATLVATAINGSTAGVTATVQNNTQISLGRIARDRVSTAGLPQFGVGGAIAINVQRGIVADGEVLRIRQGDNEVFYEFDSVDSGSVSGSNVQVSFQVNSSTGDIAESLAAAIRNNLGGMTLNPIAERDENGVLTGAVILNDLPGTQVDVTSAPTLNVEGVPGGAIAIPISPLNSATQIKQRLVDSLNSVNQAGELATTTLVAEDRGGSTFFIENASIISGPLDNYFLPAISDIVGNPLEPNRQDRTTQFTINLADVVLDFGDAPDPVGSIPGRYPTRLRDDGARHIIGNGPTLGQFVDGELDALSVRTADGDDLTIDGFGEGGAFNVSVAGGALRIDINPSNFNNLLQFDGETIFIDTGAQAVTLEFDTDGIFDEDNFAIRIPGFTNILNQRPITNADLTKPAIANGILQAFRDIGFLSPEENNTPLSRDGIEVIVDEATGATSVVLSRDDEDGVVFGNASTNPLGIFNKNITTPITVTTVGEGILEAWIDFNADGDFDDPGELIISNQRELLSQSSLLARTEVVDGVQRTTYPQIDLTAENAIRGPGEVTTEFVIAIPDTTFALPVGQSVDTYARFRVSRNGTGAPDGLALSGEVEDYRVRLVGGTPPVLQSTNVQYQVLEGGFLQANDEEGTDSFANNDGLLAGVSTTNPNGVEVDSNDVGTQTVYAVDSDGQFLFTTDVNGDSVRIPAGTVTIQRDGTFTFDALGDFTGLTNFSILVTDIIPGQPESQLVSTNRLTATINVIPDNDKPTLIDGISSGDVLVTRTINEDNVVSQEDQTTLGPVVFDVSELITPFFVAGPGNEPAEQELFFRSAGFGGTNFVTQRGGSLSIGSDGKTIFYTPPANYNGSIPDVFTYQVADQPGPGQPAIVSKVADTSGRVEIVINAINDNPILINDSYSTNEDTPLTIPVFGDNGILGNDTAGPADEDAQAGQGGTQTISLVPGQFTRIENGQIQQGRYTQEGGIVTQQGLNGDLIYTPRNFFSGVDRFEYTVVDSAGGRSTATVSINVGSVNNPPQFVGVLGVAGRDFIDFQEAKTGGEFFTYDLNSWFNDPDGDPLVYSVSQISDTEKIGVSINGSDLTVNLKAFQFGSPTFTVVAEDIFDQSASAVVTARIQGTADGPLVVGTLDPLVELEDVTATVQLSGQTTGNIFIDPDGDSLTYRVRRLGGLQDPTALEIANHPLVKSINFQGNTMLIEPQADQSGSVLIEIEASDGQFVNSHTFTYEILPVEDTPRGNVTAPASFGGADRYSVPVGGSIRITDPVLGLLRYDADPDPGSSFRIDVNSITQPVGGTGTVTLLNGDQGAFEYVNDGATVSAGDTDTFTYRLIDNTGRRSGPIPVQITFNQSSYQNPVLFSDVTADGFITAIDALRIINLLNAQPAQVSRIPVSSIETAPPDYYDVNGDGFVSAADVLDVIETLNAQDSNGNNGQAEPLAAGESIVTSVGWNTDSGAARFASTETLAASPIANTSAVNLTPVSTQSNTSVGVLDSLGQAENGHDQLLSEGVEILSSGVATAESLVDSLANGSRSAQSESSESDGQAIDSALLELFSDTEDFN